MACFSHIFVQSNPMSKRLLILLLTFTFALSAGASSVPFSETFDAEKGPVIRYYPNPIRNVLTLEVQQDYNNQYTSVEVKILNLMGQEMVKSVSADLTGINTEIKIDMTDVPAGVYFLEVYSTINGNAVKQTRKITKS